MFGNGIKLGFGDVSCIGGQYRSRLFAGLLSTSADISRCEMRCSSFSDDIDVSDEVIVISTSKRARMIYLRW